MPGGGGGGTRWRASRPSRRGTNAPRLSSSAWPRGRTRSSATLSFPGQEKRREARNGASRVGASSWKPSGSGWSRPARQTKTFRYRSSVRASRSSIPSRRQSASAHGFSERNESGPASTSKPPARSLAILPPSRAPASRSTSSSAMPRSRASSTARCAAASPVTPPPTTTSLMGAPRGPHEIGEHRDERGMVVDGGGAMERQAVRRGERARLDVEVVEDLHVGADEADRRPDRLALTLPPHPLPHPAHARPH